MATSVLTETPVLARTRLADYLQLTKPRLSIMALLTVAAGAVLASANAPDWLVIGHALLGATLVAAGASALNQLLERHSDALMQRTENRPLPAGRLQPVQVFLFGTGLACGGVVYLILTLQHPLAGAVAALTCLSYAFIYTPLKRRTSLNTLVGAIPGALPPVIGWTAVRGSLNAEIAVVFLILFLWQVPHFLAIAWIYRSDYRRAGLRMLPTVDLDGSMSGRQMVWYCIALVVASLMPLVVGGAGPIYLGGALLLGVGFMTSAVGFACRRSLSRARLVLRASLIYLPLLLALLLLDGIPHG
jgi:heme o synthase